mgnify:CR=1 FL=1
MAVAARSAGYLCCSAGAVSELPVVEVADMTEKGKRGGRQPGAGRPKGSGEYTENIMIRVSPTEKDQLRQQAEAAGMTMSEYLRSKVFQ